EYPNSFVTFILYFCTASRLRCFTCVTSGLESCTQIKTCPAIADSCFSLEVRSKLSINCIRRSHCCEEDLCNSTIPTGPSAILLLVSSAITSLFL
uniref:UPAR/Ly6 domain-containing protein n=1 Tax=Seriola dumerili TaxID=41447 RepID=A0A3B4TEU0_SERDU